MSPALRAVHPPRVVILGGGFGGLYAARALRRAPLRLTLVDRRNHHLFQPLLYQVATAALNPSDIAVPIRRILRRQANATVLLGEATAVDLPGRRVVLADGEVPYDYRFAPGLKTIEDALEIRRRILLAFEAAEREPDPGTRRTWLTFVVIGGGPTGVELAGALGEIARLILKTDFRSIDPASARVVLVEAGPRILPAFAPALSEEAARELAGLGVEVITGSAATSIDAGGVSLGTRRLDARNVLWAAGVAASSIAGSLGVPLDRAGRVPVAPDLTLPGHPEVFVIGDLAALRQDGKPVPGVAPAAKQMGRHAARNILRAVRGLPHAPFRYRDAGSLATIGRAAAVAEFGRIKLSGFIAWLAWMLIHIYFLIGFRNRLLVMLQWTWLYLRHDSGARLITGDIGTAGGRAPTGRR